MNGEKLPFLVIGQSSNPRCFKSNTFPVMYHVSQKNAWMECDLPDDLPELNEEPGNQVDESMKIY